MNALFSWSCFFSFHCIVVMAKQWASYCLCPRFNQAKFKELIFHLSHNYCLTTLNRQSLHVIFAWHTMERIGKYIVTCDKIAIIVFSRYTTIFLIGYLWTCNWQYQFVHKNLSLNFKESDFCLCFAGGSTFC